MTRHARLSLFLAGIAAAALQSTAPPAPSTAPPKATRVVLAGSVIHAIPHLERTHALAVDDDPVEETVALLTADGTLHPLLKDQRSRGFFLDKRWRDRPMRVIANRYPGSPYLVVIAAFSVVKGRLHQLDYWCDVCAIVTYEPGPCPCCQEEIAMREIPLATIPAELREAK